MKELIKIPCVTRDDRIGSAFSHLFQVILSTERKDKSNLIWDFSEASFFHPFFLFPLAIYRIGLGGELEYGGLSQNVINYLNIIKFFKPLDIKDDDSLKIALSEYESKSYVPICRFPRNANNIDSMQTVIQNVIQKQYKIDARLRTPLSYLFSELICNIKEHSFSDYGYIYTQYLKAEGCLDVCIADDGISVYGSYINTRKYLDIIGENEAYALKMANEGHSTKNRPESENRGYGISSSKKMIVNGLGGEFFMISGGAFHRHDSKGSNYVSLPKELQWNGTLILMRLPLKVNPAFDYYNYIR